MKEGVAVGSGCDHVVDDKQLPEWDPHVGKIWRCEKCGAKVFKQSFYSPPVGERIHMSKKERRRKKKKAIEDGLL